MLISTSRGSFDWSRRSEVPCPPGRSSRRLLEEPCPEPLGRGLDRLEVLFQELPVEDVGAGLGLDDAHAVLEPGHEHQATGAPVADALVPGRDNASLHHGRDEHVGGLADLHAVEPTGGHAHDRHRLVVDAHGLAHRARVGPEAPCPEAVAEHDHGMAARGAVVLGREQAAHRGGEAQDLEEVPGHQVAGHVVGLLAHRQVHGGRVVAEHTLEDRVLVAQALVHGMGERDDRVAVVVRRAGEGPRAAQDHELAGVLYGQEPQQDLVHQAEYRGVGPDPEGQGQHYHEREAGVLGERPQRELQVLPEIFHFTLRSRGVPDVEAGDVPGRRDAPRGRETTICAS